MTLKTLSRLAAEYAACNGEELVGRLEADLERRPRCPVARYLAACTCLDRGRAAPAVRHLMIAYHAEPDLESAALLVFAGLNWVARPSEPLLPVLLETWEEFRRPQFDRTPKERRLLGAFADSDAHAGLLDVGALARRLWRLPVRVLRAQIREAVLSRNDARFPMLLSPA